MRSDPKLLSGLNKLWIRFFLLAVYSTMYVRDHSRPKLYEAFGMDVTEFDYTVFDITTEISRQVFPLTLNTDDPRFRAGLERLRQFQMARDALAGQRGPIAMMKKLGYLVRSGMTFARLFLLPTQPNTIPDQVCMQPAW
jgi:magnesium-protoporphyrin IX monomethyl ester (oxidative) cyclase